MVLSKCDINRNFIFKVLFILSVRWFASESGSDDRIWNVQEGDCICNWNAIGKGGGGSRKVIKITGCHTLMVSYPAKISS